MKKVRRKYVVNKKAQYTFLVIMLLWFLVTVILFSYFLILNIGILKKFLPANNDTLKLISDISTRSWSIFGIYFLLFLILAIILSYYTSNRVFGPIYRLDKHIKESIEKKELEPVEFRKNDEFKFLARRYNELIEKIKFKEDEDNSEN